MEGGWREAFATTLFGVVGTPEKSRVPPACTLARHWASSGQSGKLPAGGAAKELAREPVIRRSTLKTRANSWSQKWLQRTFH